MVSRVWLLVLAVALAGCGESGPKSGQDEMADSARENQPAPQWAFEWQDRDGDCRSTEMEFLMQEAVHLLNVGDGYSCTVTDGIWVSWGTDEEVPMGQAWVIPLVTPQEAIRSGADDWDRLRQLEFVNDLDNLLILDPGSANARDFKGPDQWLPEGQYRCRYAAQWKKVKQRYGLSMDDAEAGALEQVLARCAETAGNSGP